MEGTHEPEVVEFLILEPIPPDTVASVRAEVMQGVEEALRQGGQHSLIEGKSISFELEHTFPTDEVVIVVVTMFTTMAVKAFEEIVIPELKKKYKARRKRQRKRSKE
jgi:hypothetical protein